MKEHIVQTLFVERGQRISYCGRRRWWNVEIAWNGRWTNAMVDRRRSERHGWRRQIENMAVVGGHAWTRCIVISQHGLVAVSGIAVR